MNFLFWRKLCHTIADVFTQLTVRTLVVCGDTVDEAMKNDIAIAERLRITATTLDGLLTVKDQGREKGGNQHG